MTGAASEIKTRRVCMRAGLLVLLVLACGASAAAAVDAAEVVRSTGIKAGLCVHLDVTDGRLTADLTTQGKFVVHGIASTREVAANARLHVASRGLHGTVSVQHGSLKRLPYVDNLVNLVVVEDMAEAQKRGLSVDEVMRVLCPDGVAYVGSENGKATVTQKPRPAEMDDWTHWLHGAECNSLSSDSLVGPADRLQWIDGPYWPISATRAIVLAGGRCFAVVPSGRTVAGQEHSLVARDAFNGFALWQREIDTGDRPFDPRLLVAVAERVFTVLKKDGPLVALDAASGETVRTYEVGISPRTVLYRDGHLLLAAETAVCSVNAETGAVRWRTASPPETVYRDASSISYGRYPHVVSGGGRLLVFLKDAPEPPYSLVCYDVATGREAWRTRHRGEILKCYRGVLVLLDQPETFSFTKKVLGTVRGVSIEDGRVLWEHGNVYDPHADADAACSGGLLWVNTVGKGLVGLDPSTGREEKQLKRPITGHCGFIRTTDRYFIGVYDGLTERETGKRHGGTWAFKNTCFLGNVPGNGLLYNSPVYCGCLPYLRGFIAFASEPEKKPDEVPVREPERLERGPAWGAATRRAPAGDDPAWSTYRHDAERSGSTSETVPRDLKVLWSTSLDAEEKTPYGKSLTPPVVCDGMVFVAAVDAHRVSALDAKTGEVRWRYLLDGRVEVPPTIHEGLCLFGANDGWVYCLRASDGELVWRFRAAPDERRIMVGGRLESPAPVPGVLVRNGVAYFASGRHSGMGEGICVRAAAPSTGKVLWEQHASMKVPMKIERKTSGWADRVHGNDLPVSSGRYLFMGRLMFAPDSGAMSLDWRQERFLSSGRARSGSGLVPFGFLYDRKDAALRLPKHYTPIRYQLTLWSYGGSEGLLLAFTRDRVFGVTGQKQKGSQYYTGTDWSLFAGRLDETDEAKKDAVVWSHDVPRGSVHALLSAGSVLYTAGPEKEGEEEAGVLRSYSSADGKKLSEVKFDDVPVFDGMAAAGGRLYLATRNGRILCFGGR